MESFLYFAIAMELRSVFKRAIPCITCFIRIPHRNNQAILFLKSFHLLNLTAGAHHQLPDLIERF